jgi:hypothetical protein
MAKPRYYLTFLGEPVDPREKQQKDYGLPEGEEIFKYLQAQLPSLGLQVLEADGSAYSWFFVVRQARMRYRIELTRPFRAFDRPEWLIVTEPVPTVLQRFSKWADRRADVIHSGIQSLLAGSGLYHSFTTYIADGEGGADWKTYPA